MVVINIVPIYTPKGAIHLEVLDIMNMDMMHIAE